LTAQTVLIAAYSGRALAASARRAGYVPLVIDACGDTDTRGIAGGVRVQPDALHHGFRTSVLLQACADLVAESDRAPIGIVLGAGFEDRPAQIAELAQAYPLLGCSADTVQRCKNPSDIFELLRQLGIAHPETSLTPPAHGGGWLSKLVGGSGGTHIARCKPQPTAMPDRYFQREVAGRPISALAITSERGVAFAFSRQWANSAPRRPYRYGGAVGNVQIPVELEARLVDVMLSLCERLDLVGLVSFDFLAHDNDVVLVDVNPRPGATLDVLDDAHGTLFNAHLAAVRGEDPVDILKAGWSPSTVAAAYLYADRGALQLPDIAWPDWSADRPGTGTAVAHHDPLATVFAEGVTPDAAETLCHERLAALEEMLYQTQNLEDASP
jgi:predicted ATP-grasp superfamily ATP-dependent carboligase